MSNRQHGTSGDLIDEVRHLCQEKVTGTLFVTGDNKYLAQISLKEGNIRIAFLSEQTWHGGCAADSADTQWLVAICQIENYGQFFVTGECRYFGRARWHLKPTIIVLQSLFRIDFQSPKRSWPHRIMGRTKFER